MLNAQISAIIATIAYFAYVIYVRIVFKQVPSISNTYYLVCKKYGTSKGLYFTAWCSVMAISVILPLNEIITGWHQYLILPCSFGLIVVGVVPNYEEHEYNIYHFTGAVISALSAITICCLEGFWIETACILTTCLIISLFTKKSDSIYWVEHACFISLLSLLILKLFI